MTAPPDFDDRIDVMLRNLDLEDRMNDARTRSMAGAAVLAAYEAGSAAERERCKELVTLASSPTVSARSWICSPQAVLDSFDARANKGDDRGK
jgi:hypothetical protein